MLLLAKKCLRNIIYLKRTVNFKLDLKYMYWNNMMFIKSYKKCCLAFTVDISVVQVFISDISITAFYSEH